LARRDALGRADSGKFARLRENRAGVHISENEQLAFVITD